MTMSIISPSARGGGSEVTSVFARGHSEPSLERAVHGLDGAEATRTSDLFDRALGALEKSARGFEPNPLHVDGRRHAELMAEAPGKVARAHARLPCEDG